MSKPPKDDDSDLEDLLSSKTNNPPTSNSTDAADINLDHLTQDVPRPSVNNRPVAPSYTIRNRQMNPSLCAVLGAHLHLLFHTRPRCAMCVMTTGVVLMVMLFVNTVINPTRSIGKVEHDYSNVRSIYDLEIGKVDHWCLNGDNDSCRCDDPLDPSPRVYKTWARAHSNSKKQIEPYLTSNAGLPIASDYPIDVAFLGESLVEEMDGHWMGRMPDSMELTKIRKLFEKRFKKKEGAPVEGVALGIAGDTSPNVLWRLKHGEMPDDFNPKVWWVSLGMNDLARTQCSEEVVVLGILRVVEEIATMKPDAKIVINSLLPMADFRGGVTPNPTDFEDAFRQRGKKVVPQSRYVPKRIPPPNNVDGDTRQQPRPDPRQPPRMDPRQPPRTDPIQLPPRNDPMQQPRDPRQPPRTDPRQPPRTDPMQQPRTDPRQPPRTDPMQQPRTDPRQPSRTDPRQPPRTDPRQPPRTDPRQPPRTGPGQKPGTDPRQPLRNDPRQPSRTDPRQPSKTDPRQPLKRDDWHRMLGSSSNDHNRRKRGFFRREKKDKINPVLRDTHKLKKYDAKKMFLKKKSVPLWPAIHAINAELRKFCEKHEHITFFDATSVFAERSGNGGPTDMVLQSGMISVRGHPTQMGFQAWETLIADRLRYMLEVKKPDAKNPESVYGGDDSAEKGTLEKGFNSLKKKLNQVEERMEKQGTSRGDHDAERDGDDFGVDSLRTGTKSMKDRLNNLKQKKKEETYSSEVSESEEEEEESESEEEEEESESEEEESESEEEESESEEEESESEEEEEVRPTKLKKRKKEESEDSESEEEDKSTKLKKMKKKKLKRKKAAREEKEESEESEEEESEER